MAAYYCDKCMEKLNDLDKIIEFEVERDDILSDLQFCSDACADAYEKEYEETQNLDEPISPTICDNCGKELPSKCIIFEVEKSDSLFGLQFCTNKCANIYRKEYEEDEDDDEDDDSELDYFYGGDDAVDDGEEAPLIERALVEEDDVRLEVEHVKSTLVENLS